MTSTPARFPADWLERAGESPASDLDLAVLLVNTHDTLEDPPDRLTDLDWLVSAFDRVGHGDLADQLTRRDLPRLRRLREVLRSAFEASSTDEVAAVLNPELTRAKAVPLLSPEGELTVGLGLTGYAALAARLPSAVARQVADRGPQRLGICTSDPCQCAFVDRTRAGTKRYCCSWCNDRHAARVYRRRKRG